MKSRIPRSSSPLAGERSPTRTNPMGPPSPLASMKTNRWFQSTFIDPALKDKSKAPRVYRSAHVSDKGVPYIPGTMKIVVGAESRDQRTWNLPKALLSRHSDSLKSIIAADSTVSEIQLPTISPDAFADFVSYMQSSIYSTNTKVAGYRSIRAHADACLLAAKLEVDKYWEAAMRQLYSLFEPLARSRRSDAKQSFIRAGDIEYVCVNATAENLRCTVTINSGLIGTRYASKVQNRPTVEDSLLDAPPPRKGYHSHDVGAMEGLRTLFFDALASHWTQYDVIYIGAQDSPRGGGFNKNDVPGDTTTWRQVCDTYPDFRAHIAKTTGHGNAWRTALLRHIDVYLDPVDPQLLGGEGRGGDDNGSGVTLKAEDVDEIKKEEVEDGEELEMEKATRRPKLTLKLTGLRRSNSEERTEDSEEALRNVKRESEEGVKSEDEALEDGEIDEGIQSEGEALGDRENENDEMVEGMDAGIEEEVTSTGC